MQVSYTVYFLLMNLNRANKLNKNFKFYHVGLNKYVFQKYDLIQRI